MGEKAEPLAAMTLNERLYARGLLERFDIARAAGDRPALREILTQVEVADVDWLISELLDQPEQERFRE